MKIRAKIEERKKVAIPNIELFSIYFKCPNCGYAEARRIIGDESWSPCPQCGHKPMYRVK